jgi:integrase
MASISKQAGSPYWYAFFRAGGRAIRKRIEPKIEVNPSLSPGASMKERKGLEAENRAKALKIALEMESVARLATQDAPEQRLRAVMADIVEKSGAKPASIGTIRFLYEEWKERALKQGANPKTIENYQSRINRFLDWLGSKADLPADTLTLAEAQEFYDSRAKEIHPTTIKKEAEVLAMAFSAGIKKGRLVFNPWAGIERVKQLRRQGQGSRRAFTPEQFQKLLKVAEGEMKGLIYLQGLAGLRIGDGSRLRWDSVDFKGAGGVGVITYTPDKDPHGKEHTEPLHPNLRRYLESLKKTARKGEPFIFPSLAEKEVSGNRGLSRMFKKTMAKAGISSDWQRAVGESGKRVATLSNHSLRYYATSQMREAGISDENRRDIIGHQSEAVHKGYSSVKVASYAKELSKVKTPPPPSF